MKRLEIAKAYTQYPGGRYREHGKGSGEEFRDEYLIPALESGEKLEIVLDGTSGYPSSFLEEAFGGLVRSGYPASRIRANFMITAHDEYEVYRELIWRYVDEAENLGNLKGNG